MSITLDEMIARVRKLAELPKEAVREVARVLVDETERTIAAGTTPDGQAWKPRKSDGGKPLQHAVDALGYGALGRTAIVHVHGPEARHHMGSVRGKVRRQILARKLTPAMRTAIEKVLVKRFQEVMHGR